MLASFHMNLTALSWIALIVGLFLVYNTVTISVIARRERDWHVAGPRGVTRRQVLALFLGEAAALAAGRHRCWASAWPACWRTRPSR